MPGTSSPSGWSSTSRGRDWSWTSRAERCGNAQPRRHISILDQAVAAASGRFSQLLVKFLATELRPRGGGWDALGVSAVVEYLLREIAAEGVVPPGDSWPAGLSLSDCISLGSLIATVVGLPLALIGAHFHAALRKNDARARIIERLTSTRRRDFYHDCLRTGLTWLDEKIDPPPFARANPNQRRIWGTKSLSVCIALSLGYSALAYLAGWVAGGPAALGQLALIEPLRWAPAWAPDWLPRALLTVAVVILGAYLLYRMPTAIRWAERATDQLADRLNLQHRFRLKSVGAAIAEILAGGAIAALFLVAALSFSKRIGGTLSTSLVLGLGTAAALYAGIRRPSLSLIIPGAGILIGAGTIWGVASGVLSKDFGLTQLLFLFLLPCLNGGLDWASLSLTRWFGRAIVAERNTPASLAIILGLAIADLVAAVALAFAVAWLLAFGIEASGLAFGLSLELGGYIKLAAEVPWTSGIWATFMVLSTLVPTMMHLVLALGAVLMTWPGNPLNELAARRLESGNEADYLFPQLYLTFGWLLPWLAVPAALVWGLSELAELFTFALGPVETLPDLLRNTAWHASDTARGIFGG